MSSDDQEARERQVRELVEGFFRRQRAGHSVTADALIAEHGELMPELAMALEAPRLIAAARVQAEAADPDTPPDDGDSRAKTSGSLQIRCPHCHTLIQVAADLSFADITCEACGSQFSLTHDSIGARASGSVSTIGHFDLVERIGLGGFGSVWKARDTELDRMVAVKIPRKEQLDLTEMEQFLREARTAAQLKHPNIVGIHEVGRDGDLIYIVTDLIHGEPLSDWLTRQHLSVPEAAELCRKIATALHHAHQMGVVHRDLKPQNIVMDADGQPHLTDFGLARREAGEITMTLDGQVLGTPAYMSPEQAQGEGHRAGPASDLYSLGVILFELLTGELPFRGNVRMLVHQVIHEEAPSPRKLNANVPRDLETICLKCLQKDPHQRYHAAQDLADELERFLRGHAIQSRPVGPIARSWRWCKRYSALSSLAAGLLVVLLAGLAGVATQWMRAERQRQVAAQERDTANQHLYHALVDQARALRLAQRSGYRHRVFDVVKRALATDTHVKSVDELRNRAAACLGDFVGLEPTIWGDLPGQVTQIAARPLTTQLAISLKNGPILLRDLVSGQELAQLSGHSFPVRILEFDAQGKRLASADDEGNILIWEIGVDGDWSCIKSLSELGLRVDTMAVMPDGSDLLVYYDLGSRIAVYGISKPTRDATLVELPLPSEKALRRGKALSVDGSLLVTGGGAHGAPELLVWDLDKRQLLRALKPGLGWVHGASISRDAGILACACEEGVAVFDLRDDWAKSALRGDVTHSAAVRTDNNLLAIGAGQFHAVKLWSLATSREYILADASIDLDTRVVFSDDGSQLIAAGSQSVRVWNLAGTSEKLTPDGHTGGVCGLAFNNEGTVLSSASKDQTVKLWNPLTGERLRTLADFRGPVQTVAFSPDGRLLATGDWAGEMGIWEAQTGRKLVQVDHQLGNDIWSVAFSPSGDYFAASSTEGATLWRIQRGPGNGNVDVGCRLTQDVQLSTGHVRSVCFSPDDKRIAWAERVQPNTVVHVWDVLAAKEILAPPLEDLYSYYHLAFYPNGRFLTVVGGDDSVEVWDVSSRQRTYRHAGREQLPTHVSGLQNWFTLTDDGHWMARAVFTNLGQALTVWDFERQRLLLQLPEERGAIWTIAWSPDRNLLAVGTSMGGPVIWKIPRIREQLAELGLDW